VGSANCLSQKGPGTSGAGKGTLAWRSGTQTGKTEGALQKSGALKSVFVIAALCMVKWTKWESKGESRVEPGWKPPLKDSWERTQGQVKKGQKFLGKTLGSRLRKIGKFNDPNPWGQKRLIKV